MSPFTIRCLALVLTACALLSSAFGVASAKTRVALILEDPNVPPEACRLDDIATVLQKLRFKVFRSPGKDAEARVLEFKKRSSVAKAAIIYACNLADAARLPDTMRASELNFVFLLETASADRDAPFSQQLRTDRNDLHIMHVRIDTPENAEIFTNTLIHKLLRPYTTPTDILSRAITSSYYRSRGAIRVDLRGHHDSAYVLASPPTDEILDAWSRVQHSRDRVKLEAFVAAFPKTLFADLARARLKTLP